MKKISLLLCSLFLLTLGVVQSQAQKIRYYDKDVFTAVTVNKDIHYTTNFTVQNSQPPLVKPVRQNVLLDTYEPTGDAVTKRPLVIYFHSGSFLPHPSNTSTEGTRTDSCAVEVATRLAKMGYFVAVPDYRLGWDFSNMSSDGENIRRFTIINAAYRGVQDAYAAIRFFKKRAAQYKIDTSRIILWGQDTGGYITLAASALDRESNIINTRFQANKFTITQSNGTKLPMVTFAENSNFSSTTNTVSNRSYANVAQGDSLNLADNMNAGFSNNFQLCVNLGGALGDLSWLDTVKIKIPTISFHTPNDEFAPYIDDILNVNVGNALPVIRVQGSLSVAEINTKNGVNTIYSKIKPSKDPYGAKGTTRADNATGVDPSDKPANASRRGLYPFTGLEPADGSPWQFWGSGNANGARASQRTPLATPARAKIYIDTVMAYFAPRACIVLNLPCDVNSVSDVQVSKEQVNVTPNPATNMVRFEAQGTELMRTIEIFDATGREVMTYRSLNELSYTYNRGNLAKGIYFAKITFSDGILTKKILFE